ncbi:hypothetical protein CMI40_02715 [Candidatus Pacearchaeota archaeon]|nr:hypothetical protein [Candidatus Pacearchaeota archaeon]|tara:strand:- start:828 stop:1169 length:342 start_codon:yes stop_codon:yes gene_type:complete
MKSINNLKEFTKVIKEKVKREGDNLFGNIKCDYTNNYTGGVDIRISYLFSDFSHKTQANYDKEDVQEAYREGMQNAIGLLEKSISPRRIRARGPSDNEVQAVSIEYPKKKKVH